MATARSLFSSTNPQGVLHDEERKAADRVKETACEGTAGKMKATGQGMESNCMECSTTASSLSSLWASLPDENCFFLAACPTDKPALGRLAAPGVRCQPSRQATAKDSLDTSARPVFAAAAELLLANGKCSASSSSSNGTGKRLPRVASDPAIDLQTRRPAAKMSKAERRIADLGLIVATSPPKPAGQHPRFVPGRSALLLRHAEAMQETTWRPACRMSAQDRRKTDLMLAGRALVQEGLEHQKSFGPA